ncbi:HlyD family efflux transporter periplasmic adaptor subunit [Segatella maculosa]|uniref:HlyD family secretion protein n=1 Tax=Segatella maculosa TaxID=439703 RepID=UPI0028D3BCBA|nr:HlyD family efflux transporter periplasmic adaptor subunit [Segatella maculosa]
MKKNILFAALLLMACGDKDNTFDATGTFEATEVTVSAEQTGKLLRFDVQEGGKVIAGVEVGCIDTVPLYLKARQIGAVRMVYQAQKPNTATQIAALRQQVAKAQQEVDRYTQLVKDGAANRKILDDSRSQLLVLQRQLAAQSATLGISTRSLTAQMGTADVEKLQVVDQLRKCHIASPISGFVLEKYAEPGEFAVIGKPLFKVADTERLFLRAYITSRQLQQVRLGQRVTVFADYGNEKRSYPGIIAWIASKSEFTPKTILTDDERADLVYAMKVAVKNDGKIKIGMYGEVNFR